MASSSRDRITVDLRGLRAALVARARGQGVTPSALLRSLLTSALTDGTGVPARCETAPDVAGKRVRLSLRMRGGDVVTLTKRARAAGLSAGDFVAGLVNQAPVLCARDGVHGHVAALTQSCDELATLSRSLRHLTALVREGSSQAAQEYRAMLDQLNNDVRTHLAFSSAVAAEVQPLLRPRPCNSTSAA